MIEIKHLNKSQLEIFVESQDFRNLDFIPISKHRANSHCKNPRLNEEDILLFLAYENDILVGYLGALPDKIFINKQSDNCAWLSCLWINPEQRGKKIAQKLLDSCFNIWGNRILVTEFTDSAKYLYDKSQIFNPLSDKKGIRLYLKSDLQKILPPKKELFQKIKPLLSAFDFTVNLFLKLRLSLKKAKTTKIRPDSYRVEKVNEIDQEIIDFISPKQKNELFKRGKDELNWILNNPWILSSPETIESKKYHFSSVENSFEFIPLKIYDSQNKLIAFILFAKRNNSLKIPYGYYDSENLIDVINVINQQILELKISTFTTFQTEISAYFSQNKSLAFHKKEITRNYIISKDFGEEILTSKFEIQDGDADCSFT